MMYLTETSSKDVELICARQDKVQCEHAWVLKQASALLQEYKPDFLQRLLCIPSLTIYP